MNFDDVIVHTFYTADKHPEWKLLGGCAEKLLKHWADGCGYKFHCSKKRYWGKYVHAWDKIPILIRSIEEWDDCKWHMIVDADILVTNFDKNLDQLLFDYDARKMYTGSDWIFPINAGIMLCHADCYDLFWQMVNLKDANPHGFYEQGVLQTIRKIHPYWEEQIQPVKHEIFNSYSASTEENFLGTWRPDNFVCHLAGWNIERIMSHYGKALETGFLADPVTLQTEIVNALTENWKKVKLTKQSKE